MSETRFYEQQINASTEILDIFCSEEENPIRWVLLFAQMQSGKTGTYLLTACEMLRRRQVKKVVVFCGHADKELRSQTEHEVSLLSKREEDLKENENNNYLDYLRNLYPTNDSISLNGMLPTIYQFEVIFGSANLNKVVKRTSETLFVWDESHYAQSLKNAPYHFFKQIGVSPDGNQEILSSKGNYFLSVSATPFSEVSDIYHYSQEKGVVTLEVSDRYNSVEKMLNDERIQFYNYKKLSEEVHRALSEAILRFPRPSYALIRTSKEKESTIIKGIDRSKWNVVFFNSKEDNVNSIGKNTWDRMNGAPQKHTAIIIRGRCRMGEVVKKAHVSVMIETSHKSKTDTVLQSFIGRACGYPEGSDRVVVWIPDSNKIHEELNIYIQSTKKENPRTIFPCRARNIIADSIIYRDLFPVSPIEVKLTPDVLGGKITQGQIRTKVAHYLRTPQECWTFQQRQFASATADLIENLNPENLITHSGSTVNPVEVHNVCDNILQNPNGKNDPSKKWKNLADNLHILKNVEGAEPFNLWRTGIYEDNEDGTKKHREGYFVHLFYFEKPNCDTSLGPLGNDSHTVFVYGVSPFHHEANENVPNREPAQIPKTSGNEVFRYNFELLGFCKERKPSSYKPKSSYQKEKRHFHSHSPSHYPSESLMNHPPEEEEPSLMNKIQLFSENTYSDSYEMQMVILKIFSVIIPLGIAHEIGSVKMDASVNMEFLDGGSIHTMVNKLHNINIITQLERTTSDGYGLYTIRW
jgi:hypothetical protein